MAVNLGNFGEFHLVFFFTAGSFIFFTFSGTFIFSGPRETDKNQKNMEAWGSGFQA